MDVDDAVSAEEPVFDPADELKVDFETSSTVGVVELLWAGEVFEDSSGEFEDEIDSVDEDDVSLVVVLDEVEETSPFASESSFVSEDNLSMMPSELEASPSAVALFGT